MDRIQVRGTPGHYESHSGSLQLLPELLDRGGFQRVLIIHGEKSWAAAEPYMPDLSLFAARFSRYGGECSESEIDRQAEIAMEHRADMIIGVGGGKVLDIAKAAANKAKVDVTLIPTLASTCAACTPLSVIYSEEGHFLDYEIYPRNTYLVLVEPQIMVHSPIEYLRAGIGDTLAKWYEADVMIRNLDNVTIPVQMAWTSARTCRDVLLSDGQQALTAIKQGILNEQLIRVIDTNLLTGGMVGGMGDKFGRIAGAHSIHNGLTQIEETHAFLHGEKVAYGILVQLVMEENWSEIDRLIPYYQDLGLPYSLQSLGIRAQQQAIAIIAEHAAKPNESIHLIKPVTAAEIVRYIEGLESYLRKKGL